jgi:general secretion pathway protein C
MDNEENKSTKYTVEKVDLKKSIKDEINKVDSGYILKKSIINKYTKNFDNIWKEIAIKEIKKDGKIDGFKIGNLSSKSVFKKLGLKIGDIIKSVNNITLTSYAQAFKIYENMDNITNLHIVLERNNKQMELDYEIK